MPPNINNLDIQPHVKAIAAYYMIEKAKELLNEKPQPADPVEPFTYASKQATVCAGCGDYKHTPLRNDAMGGYVCLTCIDKELMRLQEQLSPQED